MSRLPVIVGFGGINPAGRSSSHHAFQRLVIDQLSDKKREQTFKSLAHLMGLGEHDVRSQHTQKQILNGTLIRQIETSLFDSHKVYSHQLIKTSNNLQSNALSFVIPRERLPENIPNSWKINSLSDNKVQVHIQDALDFLLPCSVESSVHVAGQLPRGLDLSSLYPSRNHPRGLQMSIFAMSDALGSLGIDWNHLKDKVAADQISVYAGSAFGQMDSTATGGLLTSRLLGKRPTSKHLAFGMADMPANFINSYILGNLGATGNTLGACAGFLYNLRQALHDIREGRARIAIVGASEAAITSEMIEGFSTMGALATDQGLKDLDAGQLDYSRACRPFGDNRGFVLGESAQYFILMDDELALQTGAQIHGAIADVFVNADGYKKSIASPGVGNYLTLAKSVALAKSILGDRGVANSYLLAHGTGTPQNRVTEAQIINRVAANFDLTKNQKAWQVIAPKSYFGHSIAASSADQLGVALGVWDQGLLPGIWSVDRIAEDVDQQHVDFVLKTRQVDSKNLDACFINSKGFGGNNASAAILAPHVVQQMLFKKHGQQKITSYKKAAEKVLDTSASYEQDCLAGRAKLSYFFDYQVADEQQVDSDKKQISINGSKVSLDLENPYLDMLLEKV